MDFSPAYLVCCGGPGLIVLGIICLFLLNLQHCLREVSPANRGVVPGMVRWCLVPLLGAGWFHYVALAVSASLEREYASRGRETVCEDFARNPGESLAWMSYLLVAIPALVVGASYLGSQAVMGGLIFVLFPVVLMVAILFFVYTWDVSVYARRLREDGRRLDANESDYGDDLGGPPRDPSDSPTSPADDQNRPRGERGRRRRPR